MSRYRILDRVRRRFASYGTPDSEPLSEEARDLWTAAAGIYAEHYNPSNPADTAAARDALVAWIRDNPRFIQSGAADQMAGTALNSPLGNLVRDIFRERHGAGLPFDVLSRGANQFFSSLHMEAIRQVLDAAFDSDGTRAVPGGRIAQPIPGQDTLGASLSGWAGFRLPSEEVRAFVRSLLPGRTPPP